jgi:DNA modification methylase
MIIEKINIKELKPNPKNPRKSTPEQEAQLKKSLEKFGVVEPIVYNKQTGNIVGGHFRVRELRKLGIKEVECVVVDLTQEDENELNIRLNANKGDWDWEMLAMEWDADKLEEWGLDLPELTEPTELEAEEDDFEVPEGGIETDIVLGDLFEIGEHRLLCGDSTDSDSVAKLMNGENAELLFTSPPYSDMREYNGSKDLSVSNIVEFITSFYQYCEYQVINLGIQRKENDIIQYWDDYIDKAKDNGYKFLSWNIWHKSSVSVGQQSAFIPIYHEWIFVFGKKFKNINRTWERESKISSKKSRKVRQADGSMKESSIGIQQSNKEMESVFYSNVELGSIRSLHPATFPIELPTEYIKAMTNQNDIIVEPFTGSGTTMVASHQLKRKCYGMELDPKYCQVIIDRMLKLDPSLKVTKNGQPYGKS